MVSQAPTSLPSPLHLRSGSRSFLTCCVSSSNAPPLPLTLYGTAVSAYTFTSQAPTSLPSPLHKGGSQMVILANAGLKLQRASLAPYTFDSALPSGDGNMPQVSTNRPSPLHPVGVEQVL